MSDSLSTRITDSRGPVNTGPGDQIILDLGLGALVKDARGQSPRHVAEDDVSWLWQRFVHPTGFGEARLNLHTSNSVFLDGAPGSGRSAAARILLHELPSGTGIFHELLPGEKDEPFVTPEAVGYEDRLLLDLSSGHSDLGADAPKSLSSLREIVQKRSAHLVVVLPHGKERLLSQDIDRHRVEIRCPPRREVLLRHLLQGGVSRDEYVEALQELSDFLHVERPTREIADFAALILRARKSPRSGDKFVDWCTRSRAALSDQGARVAELVKAKSEGPQRALLLSAAMLHGAHADIVHQGAVSLLRTLQFPKEDRPLLEHEDLAQRFGEISVVRDPHGRVLFDALDYDTAVLTHFWNNMPDLRAYLREWVGGAVEIRSRKFPDSDRDLLVERLAKQCLRAGNPEELASAAEEWTLSPATERRLRAAAQALKNGLNDREHGHTLRQTIYDWSTGRQLSDGLFQVLVDVCAEVIAVHHPDRAVVRLHHLARRERRTRARDALKLLTMANHRMLRLMLFRLARDFTGSPRSADPDLFLLVADPTALTDRGERPRALLAETAVREWLVTGWNAVFAQRPQEGWEACARHWLHTAATNAPHSGVLLDVLVAGAAQRSDILGALYATARSGQRFAPGGRERGAALTERLLSKIAIAQGLRPTTP